MQPRPQGAFPWLWRWYSKAREKRPGDEVGDGQQLQCQDECKNQVFSSNCNESTCKVKLKEVIPRYSFFDDVEEKEIYHQKAQKNF